MKKDKKYIDLIKAFQAATNAKIISLEPSERYLTIYFKEPTPYLKDGWRYGTVVIPVK